MVFNDKKDIDYDVVPVKEYDGMGANIIKMMLNSIFEPGSMVRLHENIPENIRNQIPIFKSIKDYLRILEREGEITLTKIGNLPPKYVKEIYENNEIKEYLIEEEGYTLRTELDSRGVELTRILAGLCKYTKIRKNKLSLTKAGKDILKDEAEMFKKVIQVFTMGYNWGYLDGHEHNVRLSEIVSYNYYLIGKYGETREEYAFYLDKLLEAFPMALEIVVGESEYETKKKFGRINFLRTFQRYMEYMGLVTCNEKWGNEKLKKTELFDKVIDLSAIDSMKRYNKREVRKNHLEDVVAKLNYKK
ncbi:hypothetical protein [uncultured Ilyobacter sp.]|uniref:hypothetical protein n=1 Tax=uncultured Ilyobacter sp. TaxID=544433 RepID=UPI0029F5159C|nr:hypothetical protein [uncultured Ilyobacter sp.]